MGSGPSWTLAEDELLLKAAGSAKSRADVAAMVGRSPESCSSRLSFLREQGLAVPKIGTRRGHEHGDAGLLAAQNRRAPQPRKCMCCGNGFLSAGPSNRLCGTCRTKSTTPFDYLP